MLRRFLRPHPSLPSVKSSDEGSRLLPRTSHALNRERLRQLVRRELTARYRGSVIGVAWSLLNPIVYMIVYTVVFSRFMRFTIPGTPYPVYLLSGLLAWNFLTQSISASVNSILGNAVLVKKVAFPWIMLTVATVISAFVNYIISLVLLAPLLLFFRVPVSPALALLPVVTAMLFTFVLGLSLGLAAVNVYFRDVEYLTTIAIQVWFFMTPIIYQLDQILTVTHSSRLFTVFRWILYVNPMTWIVSAFQDVIAFHQWPAHRLGLIYAAVVSALVLGLGLVLFNRLSRRFAEEL
jgi:lipopolysaccharide transport system permease protein